jgi:transcriptional regulator with XRE-family HTH domain
MATSRPAQKGIGDRLRELRTHTGLTQGDLSRRGKALPRAEISAIEIGQNLGSSWRVRTALALGFGLPIDVLSGYLDGTLSLQEVVRELPRERSSGQAGQNPLKAYPNLKLASRLVAEDLRLDRELVRDAALRAAEGAEGAKGRTVLNWVEALKEQIEKMRSEVRLNPLKIENLAAAIELMTADDPNLAPKLKMVAARVAAEEKDPEGRSTLSWLHALEAGLEEPSGPLGKKSRSTAR